MNRSCLSRKAVSASSAALVSRSSLPLVVAVSESESPVVSSSCPLFDPSIECIAKLTKSISSVPHLGCCLFLDFVV